MRMAGMIDLARTPAEIKEEIAENKSFPKPIAPTYPYGLCLSLDDDTIVKLGLDGDLPDVGEAIHFTAMATVSSASAREEQNEKGEKTVCRRIELQITHMAVAGDEEEAATARRQRFYGKPADVSTSEGDDD